MRGIDDPDKKKILVIGHVSPGSSVGGMVAQVAGKLAQQNVEVYGVDEAQKGDLPVMPEMPEDKEIDNLFREGRKYQARMVSAKQIKKQDESWSHKKGGKKAKMPKPR